MPCTFPGLANDESCEIPWRIDSAKMTLQFRIAVMNYLRVAALDANT